ncbi:MAG: hypothetical protein KIG65_05500 [Eubacteriales bacterium]|nr:hypothetical protein [Eubacteriales bacterium]
MNNKNIGRKIIKIFTVIIAVILLIAIVAVLAMRFVVLPKISKKLQESGRGELAAIVDQNNNFGSFAMLSGFFADKGVIEFIAGLDGENVSDMAEVIETIEKETEEEETQSDKTKQQPSKPKNPNASHDNAWKVGMTLHMPEGLNSVNKEEDSNVEILMPESIMPPQDKSGTTAYERIAAVATSQEMADGLAIISKLDMGYVASLMADGLTSSEKSELKKYVYSKLTSSEISRALQLYNKYKKYL